MDYQIPPLDQRGFLARAGPGLHGETVDHVSRQIFRSYQGGSASAVPAELYRLRYDVYCIERAFLSPQAASAGLECDAYDACATHVGAYTMDDALVGAVRLVKPAPLRPYPFELHCSTFDQFVRPPHWLCGEVSRLVVRRSHRRRRADSVHGIPGFPRSSEPGLRGPHCPMLLLGLYREMYRHSRCKGIRYWFAAMERSLAHSLDKMGFRFQPIGPVANYYGKVTPYMLDLSELMARLARSNPSLWAWFEEKPFVFAVARRPDTASIVNAQSRALDSAYDGGSD